MITNTNPNIQEVSIKQLLKNKILWRIYILWFFRRIMPLIAAQILIFLIVLKIFAKNVFISKVFHNAANVADHGHWPFLKYAFFSFFNTHPLTQISILLILGVAALIIRDFIKVVFTYQGMWIRKPRV